MKVLITGGSGLLGKYLIETAPAQVDVKSTWYTNCIGADYQMDVCNPSQVSYIFSLVKPDIVIHTAANGSVDYAEQNFVAAREVNVEGTKNVAYAARDHKAKFVYISTNAVFDGRNPPYNEKSSLEPINRYGSIKREAELRVRELHHWLIIRPFLLYGWPHFNGRPNWFYTIHKAISGNRQLKLVNDTYWQPTNAIDCAYAIWKLTGYDNEVFHVASDDRVTLYEFGMKIAGLWGYNGDDFITPIASSELKGIAPRPEDTTYDLTKIHEAGIILRGIDEGLQALKK